MAALLEPQLNFIRTFPCHAKDKIRLLIQKLVELSCHFRSSLGLFVPTVYGEVIFLLRHSERWIALGLCKCQGFIYISQVSLPEIS